MLGLEKGFEKGFALLVWEEGGDILYPLVCCGAESKFAKLITGWGDEVAKLVTGWDGAKWDNWGEENGGGDELNKFWICFFFSS